MSGGAPKNTHTLMSVGLCETAVDLFAMLGACYSYMDDTNARPNIVRRANSNNNKIDKIESIFQ